MNPRLRVALITGWPVLLLLTAALLPTFPQNPDYHLYADQRTLLGIPHFWNVVSNAAIATAGVFGLLTLGVRTVSVLTRAERGLWWALFASVVLTSAGSVYYHWQPNTFTLYWDRLPITATLALLLAVTLAERIAPAVGGRALLPLLILGVWSVAHWIGTESVGQGDLRFYFAFQAICLGGFPLLWGLFPPRYSGIGYFVAALLLYGLAVLFEQADRMAFAWIGFGGHAIKHLLVGVSLATLAVMLRRRSPMGQR